MKGSILSERLFIDTWGWLALADALDPDHKLVVDEQKSRAAAASFVTTDYILDETFTRLFARSQFTAAQRFSKGILDSAAAGITAIERITTVRFDEALRLRFRYRDKPSISFTDFTSFVVMRELGIRDVLTADAHFSEVQMGFRRVPPKL